METKKIIGVSLVTTNENGQAYEDLGTLWGHFFEVSHKIPHKVSENIFSIYTDYESDYKGKYTAIIGYEVSSFDQLPEGLVHKEIGGGKYHRFLAKGAMPDAVIQTWKEIWEKEIDLKRRYTSDFEIHGPKAQNGDESEVEIFIAVQ